MIVPDIDKPKNSRDGVREIEAAPHAASLIEGHRDFGYNLETALADIIDNSISARANRIELIADTLSDAPWIALADNGRGMTEAELVEAMRLGSKNPTESRDAEDLGRFGLGLKSASFSQCRSLTVLTRSGEKTSCARWDLDRIAKRNDWSLELLDDLTNVAGHELLKETGTVVVWQKLDRLMGGYTHEHAKRAEHMNAELARTERHLRLVFHRFLAGTKPRLTLSLNGRPLIPIDPMASSHPSTQKDPEEILRLKKDDVRIRCHTLPHHKRMTRDEWEEIGGPEGHLKSQGLYIYRENRLIIAGGWLGLARQTELAKLCRIAIDIPNTMDSEWKIDVRKASAELPPAVRERLKKIVERFVQTSKRTYRRRGQKLTDDTRVPMWQRVLKDGAIVYQPNTGHPALAEFEERLPEELRRAFKNCISLIGAGLPVDSLHADMLGQAETVKTTEAETDALEQALHSMVPHLLEQDISEAGVRSMLKTSDMFRNEWERVEPVLAKILEQDKPE